MLQARRSLVQETREEKDAGTVKEDIAITPLAVPMLAGPGAISTAILLRTQATNWTQEAGFDPLHSGRLVSLLSHFAISRTRSRLGQSDRYEDHDPDHGAVARGHCRPIYFGCPRRAERQAFLSSRGTDQRP